MLHFEGDENFQQRPSAVWSKLTDSRFLAECIPGVESVSQADPSRLVCTLRPGFSFVRGTLELTLEIRSANPESALQILLHTKGIGTTSEVNANLTLEP